MKAQEQSLAEQAFNEALENSAKQLYVLAKDIDKRVFSAVVREDGQNSVFVLHCSIVELLPPLTTE